MPRFRVRDTWLILFILLISLIGNAAEKSQQNAEKTTFVIRALRIPMKAAGPEGLEALLVAPDEPGRHPLAVMTHGSPATAPERQTMKPQRLLPQAKEFARRGWATVIVMRRAYGTSGGQYAESIASCSSPDYMTPAKQSALDLRVSIAYLATLPEIDSSRIIAIGESTGGLAAIALTVDPPMGLVAAINFAGGRGHINATTFCEPGNLLSTFWILGKKSRVPMLWVYATNDHYFRAELAENLYKEFTEAGGRVQFILAPPFSDEGHYLFSESGIPTWTKYVDDFFKIQGLGSMDGTH